MTRSETPSQLTIAASESVKAFADLVSGLRTVPSTERIAVSTDGLYVNLWVLLREETRTDVDEVFRLEYETHRRLQSLLLKVHVIPLNRVEEEGVPGDATTLFERSSSREAELVRA